MRSPHSRRRQRGVTSVLVAIVLTVILGFLGLAMNIGHSRMVRGQLQNASDSAALAGARELDGTAAGVAKARTVAADYAGRHVTDADVTVGVDPAADVEVGHWNFTLPRETAFTPLAGSTVAQLQQMNAVLVRAGRDSSRGNPLTVWMSGPLGLATMNVTSQAVAVGGGPRNNDCPVPIVLPSCAIQKNGQYTCGQDMHFTTDGTFSNDTVDTIGFTSLDPTSSSVSNNDVRTILNNGECLPVQEGDNIAIQNGADFNKHVYDALASFLQKNGNTVAVPIVQKDDCPNPKFNQTDPIVGFATVTLTLAPWSNQNKVILIEGTLGCPDTNAHAGGGFFGMSPKPGLVQ